MLMVIFSRAEGGKFRERKDHGPLLVDHHLSSCNNRPLSDDSGLLGCDRQHCGLFYAWTSAKSESGIFDNIQ